MMQAKSAVLSSCSYKSNVSARSSCLRSQCVALCRPMSPALLVRAANAAAQEVVGNEDTIIHTNNNAWDLFASNVSGEWEGVTATFSPSGEPQQLPEHYVPAAFREWGVELWDWQSQCSSTVTADGTRQLKSVIRRLMPTVGCEADAIAFTEEQSGSSSSSSSSSSTAEASAAEANMLMVARADGSYSTGPAVWPSSDDKLTQLQVEHCFVLPPDHQQQQKFRVKVVQNFRRNWAAAKAWQLTTVDLHRERYDGPYTGKRELAGCGGGQSGIAQSPALQRQQLAGNWTPAAAAAPDGSSVASQQQQQLVLVGPEALNVNTTASSCLDDAGAAAAEVQLSLLPLGVWSAVAITPEGQLTHAEAGVVLDQSGQGNGSTSSSSSGSGRVQRIVSVRRYSADAADGPLQAASFLVQERA